LQAIITRLAGNSAQCKSWCLAIVSALFGFAGALKNDRIVACAIIPIVIFCLVDAAYLGREKSYRELYNSIVSNIRAGTYARANSFGLTPADGGGPYFKALSSCNNWPIYLALIAGYGGGWLDGILTCMESCLPFQPSFWRPTLPLLGSKAPASGCQDPFPMRPRAAPIRTASDLLSPN
jgi:hypothetical protein